MTIHFPDVSHYQAGLTLAGAPAVIAKASEGNGSTDLSYTNFKAQAAALGIPFCGYHWVDTADLDEQAAWAYSKMGNVPAMWDAEAAGATVARLGALTDKYRALGGNPRLLYFPHWFWQQQGSPSLTPLRDRGLHLVSSNYTAYSDDGPGWAAYGGMAPAIWQYSENHPFNGRLVDFNAFKGTVDQLRALLGLPANPPKEITVHRYRFINFPDLTSDMLGFGRVHITDGLRYRIQARGTIWDQTATQAGAGPIITVDGTGTGMPAGTTYATAVIVLCGMLDTESGSSPPLADHTHTVTATGTTGPAQP